MGSEFFWFYDLLAAAVIAGYIYRGAKKGAVGVLIGAAAAIIAFAAALVFSGPVSERLYDSFIRDGLKGYMSDRLGSAIDYEIIDGFSETDMSKALIKGVYLSDIDLEYDERGKAMLDLSSVDLTETGIENVDLSGFGIGEDFSYSGIKAGNITVTENEVKRYGLGNILLARIISVNLGSGRVVQAFADVGNKMSETISPALSGFGDGLAKGGTDAVYSVAVSILTASGKSFGDRIMEDIVDPMVLTPLRLIVFCVIFGLVMLILGIAANISKLIDRIPVVSSVNGFLGAVLGLLEGAVILLLICLIIKLLIALCGSDLVFINETVIEKTYLFRHIYSVDLLKLVGMTV